MFKRRRKLIRKLDVKAIGKAADSGGLGAGAFVLIILVLMLAMCGSAMAHSGGTADDGCHWEYYDNGEQIPDSRHGHNGESCGDDDMELAYLVVGAFVFFWLLNDTGVLNATEEQPEPSPYELLLDNDIIGIKYKF